MFIRLFDKLGNYHNRIVLRPWNLTMLHTVVTEKLIQRLIIQPFVHIL